MTVVTLTVPRPPDPRTLERVAQELNATTVQVSEEAGAPEAGAAYDFGAQFQWDASRALLQSIPGKPMSQVIIEDREDRL